MHTLLLHVTKIVDLGQAGGGYNCLYTWYAIIGSTTPLKYYGVRKVCCLVKPLDHLSPNGVFYPIYCVLHQLSFLWDVLWSLSQGEILRFDSTAHTA